MYSLGLRASYELDFWGRVGAEISSASALAHATADDAGTVLITLQRQVAGHYFLVHALDESLALQAQQIALAKQTVDLARLRLGAGYSNENPLLDAEAAVAAARAELGRQQRARAAVAMELALLLGESPEQLELPVKTLTKHLRLPAVPATLPATVIDQRPDVAAAEHRLIAAHEDLAQARAALLPQFSLSAEVGIITGPLQRLLGGRKAIIGVGPAVNYGLFDGGRGAAQIDAAQQHREGAMASYRKAVLMALADVEQALTARDTAQEEHDRLVNAAAALRTRQQQTAARIAAGRDTRFTQLAQQAQALDLQAQLVNNYRDQLDSALSLYAALGGGWSTTDINVDRQTALP